MLKLLSVHSWLSLIHCAIFTMSHNFAQFSSESAACINLILSFWGPFSFDLTTFSNHVQLHLCFKDKPKTWSLPICWSEKCLRLCSPGLCRSAERLVRFCSKGFGEIRSFRWALPEQQQLSSWTNVHSHLIEPTRCRCPHFPWLCVSALQPPPPPLA